MSPALFWAIAAALLLLAVGLLLGTLWRKPAPQLEAQSASRSNLAVLKTQLQQIDQDLAQGSIDAAQHRSSRAEIERRVLEEESVTLVPVREGSRRATMLLLAVAVPVLAVGLYAQIGTPAALSPPPLAAEGEPTPQQIAAMVAKLAERMEQQPPGNVADAEGWVMLGRSYAMLQRYPDAGRAFARALQLRARRCADPGRPGRCAGHAARRQPGRRAAAADRAGAAEQPGQPEGPGARRHGGLRAQGLRRRHRLLESRTSRGAAGRRVHAHAGQQPGRGARGGRRQRRQRGQRREQPRPPPRRRPRSAAVSAWHRRWPRGWRPATPCLSLRARPKARACRWPSSSAPAPTCP